MQGIATPSIVVSKRLRYEMARSLDGVPAYLKPDPFIRLVQRFWERETFLDFFSDGSSSSLVAELKRHLIRNDDWTFEYFFERIGAFDVSSRELGPVPGGP